MLGLDGGQDLLSVVVGGLSTTAGGLDLGGHIAVVAAEAGGGIGDPRDQGYLEHGGWSVLGVCRSSNRTQEVRPPFCQGRAAIAASTVKSRPPGCSVGFGTVPGLD